MYHGDTSLVEGGGVMSGVIVERRTLNYVDKDEGKTLSRVQRTCTVGGDWVVRRWAWDEALGELACATVTWADSKADAFPHYMRAQERAQEHARALAGAYEIKADVSR